MTLEAPIASPSLSKSLRFRGSCWSVGGSSKFVDDSRHLCRMFCCGAVGASIFKVQQLIVSISHSRRLFISLFFSVAPREQFS